MPHDPDLDTDDEPEDDLDFHDDDDDEPDEGFVVGHASLLVKADGAEIRVEANDAETCDDLLKLALDAVSKLRRQVN